MEREIKFRAWDMKLMRWEEWGLPEDAGYIAGRFNKTNATKKGRRFSSATFSQFTGLKDKNGKEIYEGDIVAANKESIFHFIDRKDFETEKGIWVNKRDGINENLEGIEKVIYGQKCQIVEWSNESCGYEPFCDSQYNCGHCGGGENQKDFKVIGNIYENSELLK